MVGGKLILLSLFCLARGHEEQMQRTSLTLPLGQKKNTKTKHQRLGKYGLVAFNYTKSLKDLVHKLCILCYKGVQYLL